MGTMATVHRSEAEVARDLHAALAKVPQGIEIVIEQDHRPVAVLKPSQSGGPGRKLSECISLAKACEAKPGYGPIPDVDFAKDVQGGIDLLSARWNPSGEEQSADCWRPPLRCHPIVREFRDAGSIHSERRLRRSSHPGASTAPDTAAPEGDWLRHHQ